MTRAGRSRDLAAESPSADDDGRKPGLPTIALTATVALSGGWMAFDGLHALVLGDFVTPKEGRFAGELGLWAGVVEAAGLEPRSVPVACAFVIYGLGFLAALLWFLLRRNPASWWGLQGAAVLGLWYLPFGTLLNLVAIGLLWAPPIRSRVSGGGFEPL